MSEGSFFVAGGTVPPGSASYVERAADRELYEALLAGEFCYILNSRQMGKSSLAVRTIGRLRDAGVRTAFVDLTRIGAAGATPEKWYAGLLVELGRALGERERAMAALRVEGTAAGRMFGFLADALSDPSPPAPSLPEGRGGSLVVFIDEVDATRTLPFSADDLFAGIRQAWNARASDPAYARLTFCLMGAALPSDLIRDVRMTPFNVGRRVELRDFTPEEARPFAAVVGEAALVRVLYWTGGHPFLTQSLCAGLAGATPPGSDTGVGSPGGFGPRLSSGTPSGSSGGGADAGFSSDRSRSARLQDPSPPVPLPWRGEGGRMVDALVQARYLDARARDTDSNLADVGNRLLGTGDPEMTDALRADVLSMYERMLRDKPVADDESNPAAARIKMSGAARTDSGLLKSRNRIYREAFGLAWVRENMPGQELRRQRRAFWKGALRTGTFATVIVAAITGLAWKNAALANAEKTARERADFEAYAASMSLLPSLWQAGGVERIDEILAATEKSPLRGWEWGYWRAKNDPGKIWSDEMAGSFQPEVSPSGKLIAARSEGTIKIFDAENLRLVDRIHLPDRSLFVKWVDGDHLLTATLTNNRLKLIDRQTKRILRDYGQFFIGSAKPAPGRWTIAGWFEDKPCWLDLRSGTKHPIPAGDLVKSLSPTAFSEDGRYCVFTARFTKRKGAPSGVVVFETRKWTVVRRIEAKEFVNVAVFSPDAKRLAIGTEKDVQLLDWRTGRSSPARTDLGAQVIDLRFSSDGRYLAASGEFRKGVLYRVDGHGLQPKGSPIPGVLYASFVPGTHRLLAGYDRNRIIDADAYGRSDVTQLGALSASEWGRDRDGLRLVQEGKITDVDLSRSPSVRSHAAASQRIGDAEGLLLDTKDPKRPTVRFEAGGPQFVLQGIKDPGPIWSFPAQKRCLIGWDEGKFRTLDLRTGKLGPLIDVVGSAFYVAIAREGNRFAVGFFDGRVGVYDVVSGRTIWNEVVHSWPVNEIRFSLDEKSILTAGQDQTAAVIDAASGRLRLRLKGHTQFLNTIAESPDGRRIATGGGDRTVRIWDANTGRELTSIAFDGGVSSVRFSQDGRRLFVLLDSGDLHVLSA